MAGKGKVAVRELGENLIRLSRVGDLSGIKDLLDTQEDHDFVAAAVNFREQKSGGFALLAAAVDGHKDTMEYLLQKGGKVDLMDKTGETVLMKVAERGTMDLVVFLVEKGADINIPSGVEGITALMKACKKGQMAVVKFLLEKGAELNSVDKSGWTALIHAAEKGYAEIVQALVDYQVNLNYVDDESGWTALMYASRYGHTDTVTTLLKAGCTLEVVDRKRNTALLLACFNRHWATAEVLIDHGVDLNAVSDVGDTALMLACLRGSLSTVQKLVAKGADLTLTNKKGLMAKDFAKTLDIQRALVELKKEKDAEVAAATAVAMEKAKPVDIASQIVLQRLLQQASTVVGLQGLIHLSDDLSTTWTQTNEVIKITQAAFVNNQQQQQSSDDRPPSPQQQQQQMAVKYHALMLRLWVEMVTFAAFYTKHETEIQRLLASTEPPMIPATQTLWSLHFAVSTCMAAVHGQGPSQDLPPSELKLSQLLALDLLVQWSRDTNATLGSGSGGDGAISKSLAQWAAWDRSEDVVIRSLLHGLAVRRGEVSTWVDPTTAGGSHSLVDTVVPRVQAQRRALTQRFYATATGEAAPAAASYLTERIPQIEQEELEKIVGSVTTQQIYASAYTDLSTLLTVLTSTTSPDQFDDGHVPSSEVIEKLIVDVTGLNKPVPVPPPSPLVPEPVPEAAAVAPSVEPAPVTHIPLPPATVASAPPATAVDKETSNPLHTSVPLAETSSSSPPPPPPSSSPASSTRPAAKLEVTSTPPPTTTATTATAVPAAPATKSSKCCCIIS